MPRKAKTKEDYQKEIRQLKKINAGQEKLIQELYHEIDKLREGVDIQAKRELEGAYKEIDKLKIHIEGLREQLKRREHKHNERGAGRKPKVTKEQISKILELREQGLSYQKISERVGLSTAWVHNIVKRYS